MDVRLTWTVCDCDEARDYVVSNVLSPRGLVSRPDNIDETVLHTAPLRHHITYTLRDTTSIYITLTLGDKTRLYFENLSIKWMVSF